MKINGFLPKICNFTKDFYLHNHVIREAKQSRHPWRSSNRKRKKRRQHVERGTQYGQAHRASKSTALLSKWTSQNFSS